MKHFEGYLNRSFVVSVVYLLTLVLGGFFILPGVFRWDYHFPLVVEVFFKATSTLAVIVTLFSAIIIPGLKLIQKPNQRVRSPTVIAAATLLIGLAFIFLHGLYVKLRSCPVGGSDAWYCQVEGKSYVGMLLVAFFFASLVELIIWGIQTLPRKK